MLSYIIICFSIKIIYYISKLSIVKNWPHPMSKIISPIKRLTLHSWMFAATRDLPKRPTHTQSHTHPLFSWCISCRQGDIWQRQREMEIKKNSNHYFIRITWSGFLPLWNCRKELLKASMCWQRIISQII